MKTQLRLALTVIVAFAALFSGGAQQVAVAGAPATLTVNTHKDDLNMDDNLCSLREAMRRAFDNDPSNLTKNDCPQSTGGSTTIKFAVGTPIVISNGVGLGTLPHIRNLVVLQGPVTIDGGQLQQQLFVQGSSESIFSLINVTIKNAKWTAISNDSGGKLQIVGGRFENNSAGGAGGGAIRTYGETTIAGTEFINNKAVRKDNNEGYKDGGAIRSTWKLTISGATFKGNVSDGQGGAIMAQAHSFDISDSSFTGNVAGGVPHDLDHSGDGGQYGSGGGAIAFGANGNTYPSTVKRTSFTANAVVSGSGGAIFHNGQTDLTITDSSFLANHAGGPTGNGVGGAIFNVSNLIVKRSSFTGNSVTGDGGALANDLGGQVTLRMVGFAGNNASGKGGAILNANLVSSEAKMSLIGVQVTGNVASSAGGGIYNHDSKYDVVETRMSVWAGNLPQNCRDKDTGDENTMAPDDEEQFAVDSKGQNYFSDTSCESDDEDDDKDPSDPGFSPDPQLEAPKFNGGTPGLLTQKPAIGSPLVDKVDPNNASQNPEDQVDIRGMPRGQNGTGFGAGFWDIGSFERDDAAADYSSLPAPSSVISIGVGAVGSPFTKTDILKIYNGGEINLAISNVAKGGAHPNDFVLTVNPTVIPQGAQAVDIACTPTATGLRSATLSFNTNDPDKPSVSYTLQCAGNAVSAPVLDSTPPNNGIVSINTQVGKTASLAITFRNKGNALLTFSGVTFSADPSPNGITYGVSATPASLAANASNTINYDCNTSTPGIKTARLRFGTNEPGTPPRVIDLVCNVDKATDPLFSDEATTTAANAPYGIAISPDGRHVYAASSGDNSITISSVNPDTLGITPNGGFASASLSASKQFTQPLQVAVSADGRFVYATGRLGNSIATFARDAETGALTHVDTVREGTGYDCTLQPPSCAGTVDGLAGAYGIAISPDGKFMYVSSITDDAVVVFGRDPDTGAPSSTSLFGSGAYFKQKFTHPALNSAYGIALSPDGANLYVTGYTSDALITLKRDPVAGTLGAMQVLTPSVATGLDGVFRVTVSQDGLHVYTAAYDSDMVCTFERNTLDGSLTPWQCTTAGSSIDATSDIVLSPDGKRVFATGNLSDNLIAFKRIMPFGTLSRTDVITPGISGTPPITRARGVVIHPGGLAAYVTGNTSDKVVAIPFNRPTPRLDAILPASVAAGGATFSLTIKGADFHPLSQVMIGGNVRQTLFVNDETLQATITAADIAAQAEKSISVFTPPVGGGLSESSKLYVVAPAALPVPVIDEVSLPGIQAGAISATIEIKGSGFASGALVLVNGSARATTFVSDKLLRATLNATDLANIGTLAVSVENAPALAMAAAAAEAPVEAGPQPEAAATDAPANAQGPYQVAIGANEAPPLGTSVPPADTLQSMPAIQTQSADAPLQAESVQAAPSDSNKVGISVVAPNVNPTPGLNALSPSSANAKGSAAELVITITGNNFVLGAQAYWNGQARATEFVNANTVRMTIGAGDLLSGGFASVTVANPSPGGGESSALSFTIVEPPPQAYVYRSRLPLVRR